MVYTNRRDKEKNQIEMRAEKKTTTKKERKEEEKKEQLVSWKKSSKHNIYVFMFFLNFSNIPSL